MHLKTRNVNTAFRELVSIFNDPENGPEGCSVRKLPSRNGPVLKIDEPVTVTYERPTERVLFNGARDANPFFHLYEALWMLAGRRDVAPLAYYNSAIASIASDDGVTFNGAYGYRWRAAAGKPSLYTDGGDPKRPNALRGYVRPGVDQLRVLVEHLKVEPESRRAVLQMWNIEDDLLKIGVKCDDCDGTGFHRYPDFPNGKPNYSDSAACLGCRGQGRIGGGSKDVCCNLSVMFSLRGDRNPEYKDGEPLPSLDMTVTNRSNDLVWGLLGANYVHFTILQEYLAANLGAAVGRYHHFTNNLHAYESNWKPVEWLGVDPYDDGGYEGESDAYPILKTVPLVKDPPVFEREVIAFVERHSKDAFGTDYQEPFLQTVAQPMSMAFHYYKRDQLEEALTVAESIKAEDWKVAAKGWLTRRVERRRETKAKEAETEVRP